MCIKGACSTGCLRSFIQKCIPLYNNELLYLTSNFNKENSVLSNTEIKYLIFEINVRLKLTHGLIFKKETLFWEKKKLCFLFICHFVKFKLSFLWRYI